MFNQGGNSSLHRNLSTTERTSTSDGNGDSKGHVTKRHRSTEEGEIIVLSSGSEDMGGASDDMDLDTDSGEPVTSD